MNRRAPRCRNFMTPPVKKPLKMVNYCGYKKVNMEYYTQMITGLKKVNLIKLP